MSDLVLWALILAFIVFGFVFLWWDADITRRKAERWIYVERLRQERRLESFDAEWDEFQAELAVRIREVEMACSSLEAVERLHALAQPAASTLTVVA